MTGVSCRLGDYCFFNLKDSWASFWGPSLVFASITTCLTFATAGYCLYVYVKSVFVAARPNSDLQAPGIARPTAIAVWRRVRAVILLQWRPITIVVVLLLDLVTAIAVFVYTNTVTGNAINHPESYTTWLLCLIVHPKDKDFCLPLVRDRNPYPATLQTPFVLLSVTGMVAFLVLSTKGMITGWVELIKDLPQSSVAFVKKLDDKGYALYKRIYDHFHRGAKATHTAAKFHWTFLTSIGPPRGLKVDLPTLRLPSLPTLALPKWSRPSLNRNSNTSNKRPKRPRPVSGIRKADISRPTNARMSIGPMVPGILNIKQNEMPGPIRIATSGKTLKMASRPSNDFVSPPREMSFEEKGGSVSTPTPTKSARFSISPGRFSEVGLVDATPVRYSKEISNGAGAIGMTSGSDFQTPVSRKRASVRDSMRGSMVGALAAGGVAGSAIAAGAGRVGPLNFHPVIESETEAETEVKKEPPEEEMGEAMFEMDDGVAWSDADTERAADIRRDHVGGQQANAYELQGVRHGQEQDEEDDGDDIWNEGDVDDEDDSLFYETSPSKMA